MDEILGKSSFKEAMVKQRIETRYNSKVIPKDFELGDLVLRRADVGLKNAAQGKLAPNWEGLTGSCPRLVTTPSIWKPLKGGRSRILGMLPSLKDITTNFYFESKGTMYSDLVNKPSSNASYLLYISKRTRVPRLKKTFCDRFK